jgi:lipopolysaccharide biosynthesis regulator YciM
MTLYHVLASLIPIAALSGWYSGRKSLVKKENRSSARLRHDYFVGLNYLINEQPDKAVDVFIKMLEVDTETVEVHLALGNLFRRRGEVDRAIRIHQNLIARPQLAKEQRIHALSELGQDYLRAGVLDRAERLFLELVEINETSVPSLRYLLNIYQQQKDWEQAIVIAQKLQTASGETMQKEIAHFYCELAEKNIEKNNLEQAQRHLKKAQSVDRNFVRANLMQAKLAKTTGQYKSAIAGYKLISQQDPDYISEIIKPLMHCYEKLNEPNAFMEYLQDSLVKRPCISIISAYAEILQRCQGAFAAIEFLAEQIRSYPSLRGLCQLIDLYLERSEGHTKEKLYILRGLVEQLLLSRPVYRCTECGISGGTLYWQCPGCKKWSTTRPIHGLEGE